MGSAATLRLCQSATLDLLFIVIYGVGYTELYYPAPQYPPPHSFDNHQHQQTFMQVTGKSPNKLEAWRTVLAVHLDYTIKSLF